jgi:VIT1/CCC1 family predicted Fe2+/Mn2+ transporter
MGLFLRMVRKNLSSGDRLAEAFYGIFMVTVIVGSINAVSPLSPNARDIMLFLALGVNIVWGIIDGVTYVFAKLADRAEQDRLVNSLRASEKNRSAREAVRDSLEGTIAESLSRADQEKIVDMLYTTPPEVRQKYVLSNEDIETAFSIFLIDFLAIFPVVIPFIIIQDIHTALFTSYSIATVSFFVIGYVWAKRLNRNGLIAGLSLASIGVLVILITFYFGW